MTAVAPAPFQNGFRLEDGQALDLALGYPNYSTEDSITASTTHTQAGAYQLTAQVSRVATVASTGDAVGLPTAAVGKQLTVINAGANAMQVYGNAVTTTDTINGTAGATGISQPAGSEYTYDCTTSGAWVFYNAAAYTGTFDGVVGGTTPAAGTFTSLKANSKLTYTGARVGTFTLNGATVVSVANTLVTANSMVFISLNTIGGTVGAVPAVQSLTASTGFGVKGTASDTSVYNYALIENA